MAVRSAATSGFSARTRDASSLIRAMLMRSLMRLFTGPRGGIFTDRAYLRIFHKARADAFTGAEAVSLLARRPYDLRHAAVSTWLNAGVPAPQVAEWAGHSVSVLLRVYAKCVTGQQEDAKRRIEAATRPSATGR